MAETLIRVEGLYKKFCRSLKRSMVYGTADVMRSMAGIRYNQEKLRKAEYWALKDISFSLERGGSLGIIGANGSGKTTLLRIINGIYPPDKGHLEIRGRVGALIAVGAGFHPHMTGRENIFLNGTILGLSMDEIKRKFDEIVEFSELQEYLDTPVGVYSSGMRIRLGFSIAINSRPDIVLIDEILAVGDKNFQIKCYQKMHELKQQDVSIILVAHNENTIIENTEQVIYLDKGNMVGMGPSKDIVIRYVNDQLGKGKKKNLAGEEEQETLSREATITGVKFMDREDRIVEALESGDQLNIEVTVQCLSDIERPVLGINFYDNRGFMYSINNEYDHFPIERFVKGLNTVRVTVERLYLPDNQYSCSATVSAATTQNLIDWKDKAYNLTILRKKETRGNLKLPVRYEYRHE